jgi:manganese-dependent inorganic pyrophosphatase
MKEKVYVFGHQNPDTDSICAAISYSYLKNRLDDSHIYEPVALKNVNKETQYVLNHFGIDEPRIVSSLKPQVLDINLPGFLLLYETDSIRKALLLISSQTGRVAPVTDKKGRLIGVVSISDLIPRMLNLGNRDVLKLSKTPIGNIVDDLRLEEISENQSNKYIKGSVHISTDLQDEKQLKKLQKQDLVLCNRFEFASYLGRASVIIVSGVETKQHKEDLIESYQKAMQDRSIETRCFVSDKSTFELVKPLAQTAPIRDVVVKGDLEYFVTYETIDDVKNNMLSSRFRRFPVVTEKGEVIGMISRSDLIDINKKKAILVDHNERGQSIEGIEDIDILEIIDHHRVSDISTVTPLYFRVEPVGCTCSIICRIYEEQGIEIPKEIAGLMLSAIISDTLLFHSPTCTDFDREMAERLSDITGVDMQLYGMEMIRAGSSMQEESPEHILSYDRKRFMFGEYKVSISQINTGDYEGLFEVYDDIIEEMEAMADKDGLNLVVLLVTDVVVEGTELIAIGDARWIAENAFHLEEDDQSIFLPGVFSRKKQIVPKLMNAAKL